MAKYRSRQLAMEADFPFYIQDNFFFSPANLCFSTTVIISFVSRPVIKIYIEMKHLALAILVSISVGMAAGVSVNKLFADEWSLFKVILINSDYYVTLLTQFTSFMNRMFIQSHTQTLKRNLGRRCIWRTVTKLPVIMLDFKKEKCHLPWK